MDRIKRLSYEVLDEYKSKFGEDFADNKKILDQISIIRSKGLKNEIAGYITKYIKKQIREEKDKQAQRDIIQAETMHESESGEESTDVVDDNSEIIVEAAETVSIPESSESSEDKTE